MDIGHKYILMCRKATEIQKFKENGIDNFFSLNKVWLPRQDQLQEMIKEKFIGHWDGKYFNPMCFYIWFQQNQLYCITEFNSMEQLWLAYIMDEKYLKKWNSLKECWRKK